jgi:hypothetical protein
MHLAFTMSSAVAVVELLAAAGVLAYVAERRRWRPPLWAALAVGLTLRLQFLLLTHMIKPYDIYNDYRLAGLAILHHHDPILHSRPTGWSYLPVYGFVLAGEVFVQHGLHASWLYIGRSFAVFADLGVIALVGVVAGARQGALRRFQYACYPLAVIDSAGRMEPTCLVLALAAFALVLHRRSPISTRRTLGAGAMLGLAVGVNTWPILFLPGLWRALPSLRARVVSSLGLGAMIGGLFVTMPLTVGTPIRDLPRDARTMLTYHGTIGTWGWSAVVVRFLHLHWYSPLAVTLGTVGALLTLAAVLAAVWWWRRAHPLDLASVAPCALLATTASFGGQYLLWPVPTLLARPPKRVWWYHVSINAWSIIALANIALPGHFRHPATAYLTLASLLVVPAIIAALPWERRAAIRAARPPGVPEHDQEPQHDQQPQPEPRHRPSAIRRIKPDDRPIGSPSPAD